MVMTLAGLAAIADAPPASAVGNGFDPSAQIVLGVMVMVLGALVALPLFLIGKNWENQKVMVEEKIHRAKDAEANNTLKTAVDVKLAEIIYRKNLKRFESSVCSLVANTTCKGFSPATLWRDAWEEARELTSQNP